MQSVSVATTVRVGNHTLTAAEAAAGRAPREPFVDDSEPPVPVDPDVVRLKLWLVTDPAGTLITFAYPDAGPTDAGVLTKQEDGRFYVDWTPDYDEDGPWKWYLEGAMELGSGQSDEDMFYVRYLGAPAAA